MPHREPAAGTPAEAPPPRGLSLAARVMVGLAVIAVVAVAAAVTVAVTTHRYLATQLDERLYLLSGPESHGESGDDVGVYETDDGDGDDDSAEGPMPDDPKVWWEDRPSDVWRAVLYPDGNLVVRVESTGYGGDAAPEYPAIDPSSLSTTQATYLTVRTDGHEEFRVLAKPFRDGWEITGLSLEDVEAANRQLVVIEAASVGALLAGLALVGWWVIRLGVAPMRRMVAASGRIAEGDLGVRLDGSGSGTESAALAASLNTMIGRLTSSIAEKERSEARLRAFVADASHELRTPLTTVLGYAQLFRKGALTRKPEQADAWARTEAEAGRMKRLVEDMLELARFDAEPQLHMTRVDVSALVREVLADASRAYPHVDFVEDHGPVAPDVAPSVTVQADADRLRQAVINVVSNAAIHGASHVAVVVAAVGLDAEDARSVRVDVRDDGLGMPPEVAARATERLVRGDGSRSRATGGAGLGLAITAVIVEAHGGSLAIDSVEGVGTTVSIELPA